MGCGYWVDGGVGGGVDCFVGGELGGWFWDCVAVCGGIVGGSCCFFINVIGCFFVGGSIYVIGVCSGWCCIIVVCIDDGLLWIWWIGIDGCVVLGVDGVCVVGCF